MKRFSVLCALAALLGATVIASSQGQRDLSRGLVGYWRFDEGEGDVIFDSSGNEHHGGAKNGPQWGEGKFGMALQFDGIDDVVEIPHADQLVKFDQITIALWVKLTGPPDQAGGKAIHGLLGKGGYKHGYRLVVRDNTKTVVFQLTGEKFTLESRRALTAGQWHHIAATYDGSKMRLYIDGIVDFKEKERTGPIDPNTVPLVIGGKIEFYANAILDEVRIYSRALTAEEARALYQYVPPPSFKKLAVVINEIAWSGTLASPAHEWIELYNSTDKAIDLQGWRLVAARSGFHHPLRGTVPPQGYYLLEAHSDNTVRDIRADLVYFASLKNSGDTLMLLDPAGNVIDTANGDGGPWPAGTDFQEPLRASMERIDPKAVDTDTNWKSNNGQIRNGRDAQWNAINGTPKAPNSARR